MPILRYFTVVGASLLALLFLTDAYLPRPVHQAVQTPIDKTTIRIASTVRVPPPIIIDASLRNDGP